MSISNFQPRYLVDLTTRTLDLDEPGIRVITAKGGQHVASVLPNSEGFYDLNIAKVLVQLHDQDAM